MLAADLFGYETYLPGWAAIPIFLLMWGGLTYGFWEWTRRFIAGIVFTPGRRPVEIALKSLHGPLVALVALLGVYFALDSSAFPIEVHRYGGWVLVTALAIVLLTAALRVTGAFVDETATRYPGFSSIHTPVHYLTRTLLVFVGVLMWMQAVGIPVAALLGAAGVVGVAAGLALQDTLKNFAAGVHLAIDRTVRAGDVVTLEDGTAATVLSIGWRSTRLRRADQAVLIVPNRALAEQKIVNHSQAQRYVLVSLPLRLPKEADLGVAESLVRDELARAAEELEALRREPPPRVSPSPGYSHTHLELTVVFAVEEFRQQKPIADEVLRRVYDRLRTEGIGFSPKAHV